MNKEEALEQEAKDVSAAQQPGYALGHEKGIKEGYRLARLPGVAPQPVGERLSDDDLEVMLHAAHKAGAKKAQQRIEELEAAFLSVARMRHHEVHGSVLYEQCVTPTCTVNRHTLQLKDAG